MGILVRWARNNRDARASLNFTAVARWLEASGRNSPLDSETLIWCRMCSTEGISMPEQATRRRLPLLPVAPPTAGAPIALNAGNCFAGKTTVNSFQDGNER